MTRCRPPLAARRTGPPGSAADRGSRNSLRADARRLGSARSAAGPPQSASRPCPWAVANPAASYRRGCAVARSANSSRCAGRTARPDVTPRTDRRGRRIGTRRNGQSRRGCETIATGARCLASAAASELSEDHGNDEQELRRLRSEVAAQRRDIHDLDDLEHRQEELIARLREEAAVREGDLAALRERLAAAEHELDDLRAIRDALTPPEQAGASGSRRPRRLRGEPLRPGARATASSSSRSFSGVGVTSSPSSRVVAPTTASTARSNASALARERP